MAELHPGRDKYGGIGISTIVEYQHWLSTI